MVRFWRSIYEVETNATKYNKGRLPSIVQEPLVARKKRRNEFFSIEIAPIHESMKAINEDYMSSFSELLDLLETPRDIGRTIELLKKKRLLLVAKRKDTLAYGEVLEAAKKHGYIRFSGFIDEFESLIQRGVSPFETPRFSTIESSVSPVYLVKKAYSEAVHNDIPEAWKQYSKNFHALRLELTC
jgi:hypothetical protein